MSLIHINSDECLLVNTPNPFNRANVISILRPEITRMHRFNFTQSLFFLLGLFQSLNLSFGENKIFPCHFGFQGFQPFLETFQIVAQPNGTNPAWRNK